MTPADDRSANQNANAACGKLRIGAFCLALVFIAGVCGLFTSTNRSPWLISLSLTTLVPGVLQAFQNKNGMKKSPATRIQLELRLLVWAAAGPVVFLLLEFDFQHNIGFIAVGLFISLILAVLNKYGK